MQAFLEKKEKYVYVTSVDQKIFWKWYHILELWVIWKKNKL